MKEILAIIPVFNESRHIRNVLKDAVKYCNVCDLLVINDGSNDNTLSIVQDLNIDAISLPFNTGYGNALQTGFKYALRHGYRYLIHFDGDGQHELSCLPQFIEALFAGEADVVIGSRFLEREGDYRYSISIIRKAVIYLLRGAIKLIAGIRITDPTSGFIGYNRKALEFMNSDYYPPDYPDADVIIMLSKEKMSIKEIPVVMYNLNNSGTIHTGIKPLYYMYKMFLSVFLSIFRLKKKTL